MIEDIERDPSSSEFLSALRMREWDLDSDLDKVKRPMDLYTVKAQLLNGDYHTYENCFADIQLIWDNCKEFNEPGTELHTNSVRMELIMKLELDKFRSTHNI